MGQPKLQRETWTLISPSEQTLWEEKRVQESIPDYTPGWLTSMYASLINLVIIYLSIYLFVY